MRIYSNENEKEIELIIKERIKDFNEMFEDVIIYIILWVQKIYMFQK